MPNFLSVTSLPSTLLVESLKGMMILMMMIQIVLKKSKKSKKSKNPKIQKIQKIFYGKKNRPIYHSVKSYIVQ